MIERIGAAWDGFERYVRRQPRRNGAILAFVAGLLTALAQPPFGFLPGLLGYALLLWTVELEAGPRPWRQTFLRGWLAGTGYFLVSCFWIVEAFLVDRESYGLKLGLPAAAALAAGMGLFWGLFALLYCRFAPKGTVRFVAFATVFSLIEMTRGMIFTGFPWNPAGTSWRAGSAMSQVSAYVGVYGLGFLTVLIFCTPAVMRRGRGLSGYAALVWAGLTLAGLFLLGEMRLRTTVIQPGDYVVRVVQPNIGQKAKWSRGAFDQVFMDYVTMSQAPPQAGRPWPDLIIWPEGALPTSADNLLAEDSWTAPVMMTLLRENQSLIFGAYHSDFAPDKGVVWRNSLIAVRNHKKLFTVSGAYHKYKIVPFGEFLPYEEILEKIGFKELVNIGDGFTPGARTAPVTYDGIPRFLPLICFEGIFPSLDMTQYGSSKDKLRPQWIVNISNDAWFGPTTGPRQHLNLASFRSIEEGLAMVRSTPTGVSGLIDPMGRLVPGMSLDLGNQGWRDIVVPPPVAATDYSNERYWFTILSAFLFACFVTNETVVRVKTKKAPANS